MAVILNIDSSLETASISLADGGTVLGFAHNMDKKDHAAWLHDAIAELMTAHNRQMDEVQAVAVTAGPGSYTGLRVGMATAKGLCFALEIPMITIGTLTLMAHAAIAQHKDEETLFCPMIDARRMEVFTAVYDPALKEVQAPNAMLIDEASFNVLLSNHRVLFFGNGSKKFKTVSNHPNASFVDIGVDAFSMSALSQNAFAKKQFADVAYAEPLYVKEFYTPPPQPLN